MLGKISNKGKLCGSSSKKNSIFLKNKGSNAINWYNKRNIFLSKRQLRDSESEFWMLGCLTVPAGPEIFYSRLRRLDPAVPLSLLEEN